MTVATWEKVLNEFHDETYERIVGAIDWNRLVEPGYDIHSRDTVAPKRKRKEGKING